MLKLRSIDLSDYAVLDGEQRIGRIRFADARMPGDWLWNVTVPLRRTAAHGFIPGPRHGQGGLQGGLGSSEGQDDTGAARGGRQGNEHPGLISACIDARCLLGRLQLEFSRSWRRALRDAALFSAACVAIAP